MDCPIKPDPSDCCGSGCNPCILDVYQNRLKIYEDSLKRNVESMVKTYNNCMSATSYSVFKFIAREKHTHDTYFYVFEYCRPHRETDIVDTDRRLFYKPGQHFLIKAYDTATDSEFTRAYTPIPHMNTNLLSFTIIVRIYKSGKMSTYLHNLEHGQETLWRGPYCDFTVNYSFKNILFVAQEI
ncbi:hypothetical protein WA026_005229 [Henosepilachna vigintioctopunctata]|uniref:FAD-binding FR-type domain-containing protein n=1 Tax=Henosepilachna vigintioctopunctata TaxID=420089 RepID=A0AAW1ULB0_9CUCU